MEIFWGWEEGGIERLSKEINVTIRLLIIRLGESWEGNVSLLETFHWTR